MIRVEEGEGTATFSISKERSFVTGAPNISASPTRSERFSWKKKKKKGTGRKTQGGGRGRFEGVGVFSRRVVESVSGLEPNAGEDRTPRRNSVEGNT